MCFAGYLHPTVVLEFRMNCDAQGAIRAAILKTISHRCVEHGVPLTNRPILKHFATLALLILVCSTSQVQAQDTASISGFVKDAESGETLILANLRISGSLLGAATNTSGYYTITGLPAATYTILVSYIGYQSQEIQIDLSADEHSRLDIELSPLGFEVGEIVVTAEADSEEEQRQLGASRMQTATIRKLPTILEPDVFRSLQLLPGVKAASDYSSGLYIRGGSPDQTLILLDRTTVYNPSHFFGVFSTFNPDAIKDVRLFKGAYPASYGGRIGSVVDIYNKDGNRNSRHGTVSLGLLASRAMIEGPHKWGSWMLAVRRSTVEPILAVARNADVNGIPDTFYFIDANGKLNLDLSQNDRVSMSFYAGKDVVVVPIVEDVNAELRYGNETFSVNWTHLFSDRLFSNFTFTRSHYFSNPSFEFASTYSEQDNQVTDYSVKGDFEFIPDSRRSFKAGFWGGQFRFDLLNEFDSVDVFSLRTRSLYGNGFAESIYRPSAQWTITTGVRGSYFENGSFFRVEPRLSIERRLTDRLFAQFGTGRFHQFLTLVSNEAFSGLDVWLTSAAKVPPAHGDQFVTGLKYRSDSGFRLEWEGYYRTMQNLFTLDPFLPDVAGLDYHEMFIFGKGYAWGSEVFVEGRIGPFTGFAGYTYGKTRRRFPAINEDAYYAPKYDRTHDLNVTGSTQLTTTWQLTAVFNYATGQAYTEPSSQYRLTHSPFQVPDTNVLVSPFNGARLPAYHRLDVGATKTGRLFGAEYELQLQVVNVYNRSNIWFPFFEFEDDGSVTREDVPQIPIPIPNVAFTLKF